MMATIQQGSMQEIIYRTFINGYNISYRCMRNIINGWPGWRMYNSEWGKSSKFS